MNYKLSKILSPAVFSLALVVFSLLLFVSFPAHVQAAEMFFVNPNNKLAGQNLLAVTLLLNTEAENINAVGGKVTFPPDLLELKSVQNGSSIINLWINNPALQSKGQVNFSGITPGGYKGSNGVLFSLVFKILKSGPVNIGVIQGQALLNDGKGTAAKLSVPKFFLQVKLNVASSSTVPTSTTTPATTTIDKPINYNITDKTPPESIVLEIAKDSSIENGKWFVTFISQDKESGIDHYEVQENLSNQLNSNNWQIISSPYILQDQALKSFVYIKAVDRAGNSMMAVLAPKNLPLTYQMLFVYVSISAIVIIAILLVLIFLKRKKFILK